MPFGIVNSGSTYNRMVRKLLDGAQNFESYVDDVLGHKSDWSKHKNVLRDFFERIRNANCKFCTGILLASSLSLSLSLSPF